MSFDPMAAAVDWLDAYRAGGIERILAMYAEDAVVHCGCEGIKIITSKDSLRAYWVDRLWKRSASHLDNVQLSKDGTVIAYVTREGVVSALLTFNASGQIASLTCGPLN
ncbi:ketosteroid isomerase-like protein [Bradyrhizobium japonicum]|uniref:nuclear transport factor 2 family protein n=1 Tax=Bradyrhizobium japonicum TaxID=375 RepID=UPI002168595B|nr:nuclear transport factor 2 family protein [Bradyrhizobium japonicum]MCS3495581.1 ketosteroid isomerase-like protein [Bradyrhizobium japonicum]MCS3962257.1 ketosteroid isomerase-like protein [Bradyrhizobium japonicum]MCS3994574.1 ketosteroid isomerase-like protein [Bradyrhizobium japonicum]